MSQLLHLRHRMRNLFGVLFVFAFFANTYEALIPDVHDGDATITASSGKGSAADGVSASQEQRPAHSSVPDLPHHAQHVDHCTHSHVASVSDHQSTLDDTPVALSAKPSEFEGSLRGIAHAPGLRPPIT